MSFIETLDEVGIVWTDYDAATGWPAVLNLDLLVTLQYPDNDRRQIALRRTLISACRRAEIASTPAMAWAGLYHSSAAVPFTKLLETTDRAISAHEFSKWLARSDTKPSSHVEKWFANFGVAQATTPASDGPAWQLKPPPKKMPGYRWPLYQFLKSAHGASERKPKALEVLSAWKLNPPAGIRVIEKGQTLNLEYTLTTGGKKIADLKAVQQVIDALIV